MKKCLLVFIALLITLNLNFLESVKAEEIPEEEYGWDYSTGWFDKNPGKFTAPLSIYDNNLQTAYTIPKGGTMTIDFKEPITKGVLGYYSKCSMLYGKMTVYSGSTIVYETSAPQDICVNYRAFVIDKPITKVVFAASINAAMIIYEFDVFTEINPEEYLKVENLKVINKSIDEVNVEWNMPKRAVGTRIYLDGVLVDSLNKDGTTYKIKGLVANKEYRISVSAIYKTGESELSDLSVVTNKIPNLPSDFVSVNNINDVSAVFKMNVDKLEYLPKSIKIYKSIDDSKEYMNVPVYSSNPIEKKIDNLKVNTTYKYFVSADYGKTGVTEKLLIVFKTLEPNREVESLSAVATAQEVSLRWKMPEYQDLDVARIYRQKSDAGVFARTFRAESTYEQIFETNGTTFKDLTVKADTEYTYKVTTVDTNDNETEGKIIKVRTKKMSVSGGDTEKDENGDYVVTWTSPTKGKIKVYVGGELYATVDAVTQKYTIPGKDMKYTQLGGPDVKLMPVAEDGTEGEMITPEGTGLPPIDGVFDGDDLLGTTMQLVAIVGGLILLSLSFPVVRKLIKLIRNALSRRKENAMYEGRRRIEE